MDKRAQVFVSSTFVDLADERQRVIQTLLELGCFPAGMELFPASDEDKWDLIQGVIDDSDYYLLILGGRYGSEDGETQLSYTQMEYEYAVEIKKPVMAFLFKDLDKIELGKTDKDPSKEKKLHEFRKGVSDKRSVKFFSTTDELAAHVATSLVALQRKFPAVGWVRGDLAMTPEVRAEIAELRAVVAESHVANSGEGPLFDDLADGDTPYVFPFRLRYKTKDEHYYVDETDIEMPWAEIFSEVGPTLLHEKSEHELQKTVSKSMESYAMSHYPEIPEDYASTADYSIRAEPFEAVKVQLFALGLIERGTQKRTVSDRAAYWKLTRYGEDRLMKMRAIRKSGVPEPIRGHD